MTTRGPAIKPGDVVTWHGDLRYWRVVADRGSMLLIEREFDGIGDSRDSTFRERRLAQRRACRLVGSQTEMEL